MRTNTINTWHSHRPLTSVMITCKFWCDRTCSAIVYHISYVPRIRSILNTVTETHTNACLQRWTCFTANIAVAWLTPLIHILPPWVMQRWNRIASSNILTVRRNGDFIFSVSCCKSSSLLQRVYIRGAKFSCLSARRRVISDDLYLTSPHIGKDRRKKRTTTRMQCLLSTVMDSNTL